MSRFYVSSKNIKNNVILIDGNEAHHVVDVMRLKENDNVVVFDGTGKEYNCKIGQINKKSKEVLLDISSVIEKKKEKNVQVFLGQAIPKKDKMNKIVEKSTELGVFSIIPLITERTNIVSNNVYLEKKCVKWNKISIQASKQCARFKVPIVEKVKKFSDIVKDFSLYDMVLMACLVKNNVSINYALSGFKKGKILILIGPEGDFSKKEINLALKNNCKLVDLGERVLKSDTAALYMLSILDYKFSI